MAEPRILILGGYGETGRHLADLLLARTRSSVVVCGRDGEKARALAAELNRRHGGRTDGVAVDASDDNALRRALDGMTLLVNATTSAVPIGTITEAAIDLGADVVDLQFPTRASDLERLAPRIEEAGRCVVTQAGFHPGVPAALVRWASLRMEVVEFAWAAGLLRPAGGIPYTPAVDDLVESFRHYTAHELREGRWQRIRLTSPRAFRKVWFDFGFGPQRTSPMDLDEMRGLPQLVPGLRRTGFSVAGFDPVTDWVVTSVIMVALPLFGRRAVTPMGRLLCWSTRTFGRPPFGIVVQLEAEGWNEGERARLRLGLFHEDGYDMTAIPTVSMIEQLLDGSARRPGLHLMGLLADPERLLADVGAMGVRVRALVA